jgi:hypothetical protein
MAGGLAVFGTVDHWLYGQKIAGSVVVCPNGGIALLQVNKTVCIFPDR